MNTLEQQNAAAFVDHFSYSSLMMLCRNALNFKKVYILKIYEEMKNPSAIVGQACHKAVEVLLRDGLPLEDILDEVIEAGVKKLNEYPDNYIEFGKTGSRKKMLKAYHSGINTYLEECEKYRWERDTLYVEEAWTKVIHNKITGEPFPVPAKCRTDWVWRSLKEETFAGKTYPMGTVFIEDHKFVASYTDDTDLDPTRFVQAMFNRHILDEVLKKEGLTTAAMLYNEVKLTKNENEEAQAQYTVLDFAELDQYLPVFYQLYNDVTAVANGEFRFLPNFQDMFDGKQTWVEYSQNIIGTEAPVPTTKKKEEVRFVEKSYVPSSSDRTEDQDYTDEEKVRRKLSELGLPVTMKETYTNGAIKMFTFAPSRGIRMSAFDKVANDLAIALESSSVRVQAPIRGTKVVGVEVPVQERSYPSWTAPEALLEIPLGLDVYGTHIRRSLADMPHLLVAGTTGSGKSVFLHNVIRSLTSHEGVKLILVDLKRVEFGVWANDPHLLIDPIYTAEKANKALAWAVAEMHSRYEELQKGGYRSIAEANADRAEQMDYIAIVVDEFAQLMLSGGAEERIVEIAQMGRAAGVHLILSTQRPTVDVVTGLIKANIATRACFKVTTALESSIVLDQKGAQELSKKGDMLFMDGAEGNGIIRLQGYNL